VGLARQNSKRPRVRSDGGAQYLQLSLEEGFFLAFEKGALSISAPGSEGYLDASGAKRLFSSVQPHFAAFSAAYSHFRREGWEVTSGLKYGVDYLLYPPERAPQAHSHAPFSVLVHIPNRVVAGEANEATQSKAGWGCEVTLSWKTIQGYSRLACQARPGRPTQPAMRVPSNRDGGC